MLWEKGLLDNITAVGVMKRHLNERLFLVFENDDEIIYIPAGRSLLATMSEQLQDVSTDEMDLTMQEFIKLIKITKNKYENQRFSYPACAGRHASHATKYAQLPACLSKFPTKLSITKVSQNLSMDCFCSSSDKPFRGFFNVS